jgi:hypothetical protein
MPSWTVQENSQCSRCFDHSESAMTKRTARPLILRTCSDFRFTWSRWQELRHSWSGLPYCRDWELLNGRAGKLWALPEGQAALTSPVSLGEGIICTHLQGRMWRLRNWVHWPSPLTVVSLHRPRGKAHSLNLQAKCYTPNKVNATWVALLAFFLSKALKNLIWVFSKLLLLINVKLCDKRIQFSFLYSPELSLKEAN